jgi:hypothetical protein
VTTSLTTATFRRRALAALRRANPDKRKLRIEWTRVSPLCPYADGTGQFRTGHGTVFDGDVKLGRCQASVDAATLRTIVR